MTNQNAGFDGLSLITPEAVGAEAGRGAGSRVRMDVDAARRETAQMLDRVASRLADTSPSAVGEAARDLFEGLSAVRSAVPGEVWRILIPEIVAHPVRDLILQDPFTGWSFEKPRGYSGDAHLLDFIYRHASTDRAVSGASDLGRALFDYTVAAPAAEAVRERRRILATLVDEAAGANPGEVSVLSIAAGHLREADLSASLASGGLRRWVALDQDPASVSGMRETRREPAVEPGEGSVKALLDGSCDPGTFDLVYAAGLYDYLPRPVAIRFTRRCLEMLEPGGTFVFANFHVRTSSAGFMETFMRWDLIFRDEADMQDIVDASLGRRTSRSRTWTGDNGEVVYTAVTLDD